MASTARVALGLPDHIRESQDGDTWVGGPGATAVSEQAGSPVALLADDLPGKAWRSVGLTEADGRVGRRFVRARPVGVVTATGHNLTQRGLARWVGGEWVFRNAASLATTASLASTTADLTAASDATYYMRFRMPPVEVATAQQIWWRSGAGVGNSDHDARLTMNLAGADGFRLQAVRYSGTQTPYAFPSNPIDDGRPHEIVIRFDGSAARVDLELDEAVLLNQATTPAFSSPAAPDVESVHFGLDASVAIDVYEFVRVTGTATISTAELRALAIAHHQDASPVWWMNGTFPVVNDETGGGHTATTGAGTQVDRVNELPEIDSGTIKPYGDWAQVEALRVQAGATVLWGRSEAPPRRFTVSFLARFEASAVAAANSSILIIGHNSGTADFLLQVRKTGMFFRCLRTSNVGSGVGSGFFDGDVHDMTVTIDGRLDLLNAYIDGSQVITNFAIGVYVSQASFNAQILGAAVTRWTIAALLVTRGIHPEQRALTDPAPWVEREKIIDARLDGDTVDFVDDDEPTPSGSTEFVTITNPSATADTRAGSVHELAADPLRGMPAILARDAPETAVLETALLLDDPGNPEGYFEIDSLRFSGALRTAHGRRQNGVVTLIAPAPAAVVGGGFRVDVGPRYDTHLVSFGFLTREESEEFRRRLRIVGRERPFTVLAFADDTESSAPMQAVWGVMLDEPKFEESPTDTRGRFGVTVVVASMMVEPLRL